MPRERWKLALDPFAHSLAGMMANIADLSDGELLELNDALSKATQTNCWVYIYKAAQVIRHEVEVHMKARKLTSSQGEPDGR